MSTLAFARDLAEFEQGLEWMASHGDLDPHLAALAVSYKSLIDDLVRLDGHLSVQSLPADLPRIPAILSRAMSTFRDLTQRGEKDWQKRYEDEKAERNSRHAEDVRRHELAVTVECPSCGAQPGKGCRTTGPGAGGYGKGINDHKARYRFATDPGWKRASAPYADSTPRLAPSPALPGVPTP